MSPSLKHQTSPPLAPVPIVADYQPPVRVVHRSKTSRALGWPRPPRNSQLLRICCCARRAVPPGRPGRRGPPPGAARR
eukprot:1888981-Alexandrium_andersonii.AAC.1